MQSKNHYAISGGHKETVTTAEEVLRAGGNAVDAAIAAYWMMFISEPCMASAGAGGFAMVKMHQDPIFCLDFFCQTPIHKRPTAEIDFYPITVDFGNTTEDFHVGRAAAATPGAIAGLCDLHDRYGTIPMHQLAEPTIAAAKEGVALDKFQAYDFSLLQSIFAIDPNVKNYFFRNEAVKKEGDIIAIPEMADFIASIVHEGKDLFYKGDIARQISEDMREDGSLTYSDFSSYDTYWRFPLDFTYRDNHIYTTPSPSAGGEILAAFMKMDESSRYNILSKNHFDAWFHACQNIQDVESDIDGLRKLLSQYNIVCAEYNQEIKKGGTSHLSILDRWNNVVSLTTSLGEGNGYFIPNTGMRMNNMLGESALLPNGLHSWKPSSRLKSMMAPTISLDQDGIVHTVTGSGGAGRIPYAIAQLLIYIIRHDLDLEEAIRSPRLFYDGNLIQFENGFLVDEENTANRWDHPSLYFGGTHSISKSTSGTFEAFPDARRFAFSRFI